MLVALIAPPPRGPGCISADTRARTPSKNTQHACISVSSRASASSSTYLAGRYSKTLNEIPQKSVEPFPGYCSTTSIVLVSVANSASIPARFATGAYRGT